MAFYKTGGSKLWVSPTEVDVDAINAMDDAARLAFYEGISDWIEVEEKENLGTVGDSAENIPFTTIGGNRTRNLKGPRNAGTQEIVVGRDSLDDGQEQLIECEGTDFNYAFKIELNDAKTSNYSKSVMYYAGLVMSRPTNMGANAQVTTRTFSIGINTSVFEVGSAVLAAPVNTVLPAISGTVATGEVLTAYPGTWTNSPTLTYQWQADDAGNGTFADISGATSQTFTAVVGNEGDALRVKVTGVNGEGTPVVAFSAPTQLQTA